MRKVLLTAALALLMASPSYAQVVGKWEAVPSPGEPPFPLPHIYEFKLDSGNLTGTLTVGTNPPIELREGTVARARISFLEPRPSALLKMSGEIKGDEITLNREVVNPVSLPPNLYIPAGPAGTQKLKRVKK